jgi:mannose-6-phosphate isomerase-like protein (cupin superfamily)
VAATRRAAGADEPEALIAFEREGCSSPRRWSNAPGDRYDRHAHAYRKVLFCLDGSIVFHIDDDDLELREGDRLDLDPGTPHAATVGPAGCRCIEASR